MDVHKPKPWRGWPEFLKEIGTIVIGVLIALGAEQLAEGQHWRHKIHEAEHAMRLELEEDDGPQAYARLIAATCFDAQLDGLARLASDRAERRAFRTAALAYAPPGRTWDQQSWESAVASDVGTHMGADELMRWSTPYRGLPALERTAEEELHGRSALAAVRDADGPLTEAEADRAIGVVAELRAANTGLAGGGLVLLQAMKRAGVELGAEGRARILRQARAQFGACAYDPTVRTAKSPGAAIDDDRQFDAGDTTRAILGLPPLK